jgi:hypothetical protein
VHFVPGSSGLMIPVMCTMLTLLVWEQLLMGRLSMTITLTVMTTSEVQCPHYPHTMYPARDYVGKTFTVPPSYIEKSFFGHICPVGKIHSVVRKGGADANDIFF